MTVAAGVTSHLQGSCQVWSQLNRLLLILCPGAILTLSTRASTLQMVLHGSSILSSFLSARVEGIPRRNEAPIWNAHGMQESREAILARDDRWLLKSWETSAHKEQGDNVGSM